MVIILGYFFIFLYKKHVVSYFSILTYVVGFFFPCCGFLLHKNICCGYSHKVPHRGASNEYPQHIFLWRNGENYPIIITKYFLTKFL